MSYQTTELTARLKAYKYSVTSTRQMVFAALENREPQSMHDLVKACQGNIDRASIYRTIALFEKLGIIQRLQIGWKYKLELTDTFSHHHHHLTCDRCGITTLLPADEGLEQRLKQLADQLHFVPKDHQIEVRGICENCLTA